MKTFAFFLMAALPIAAHCQQDRAVGIALERYSVLIGAIQVNGNCKFLSEVDAKDFGRNLGLINFSLMAALGDASRLASLTVSAKKVADSDVYKSCEDAAKEVVSFGVAATRVWSAEIREAVFGGAARIQSLQPPAVQK